MILAEVSSGRSDPESRFSTKLERIAVRYDTFVEEFSSILARQAHVDDVP